MGLLDFLLLLLVAGVCGGIAQAIAGYSRTGCFGSIVLGFIGALLGIWLSRTLELPTLFAINFGGGFSFPIVWSVIGATIFVGIVGLLFRGRR